MSDEISSNPFVMDNASETSLDPLIRDLVDLNNALEHAMRGKVMFGIKSDCDVSYYEAEYLVSKGWNPEIFED